MDTVHRANKDNKMYLNTLHLQLCVRYSSATIEYFLNYFVSFVFSTYSQCSKFTKKVSLSDFFGIF